MSQHRNFEIETTIVPDPAGQYEAAFVVRRKQAGNGQEGGEGGRRAGGQELCFKFPPVGSYMTPDDAREQTEAWAHKWIDANFSD
ncbi:hypothetical protein CAL14_15295 [Bordetella genomosp. 9]|uniref:hypothetical protein n=1 Tax=Bordetella genomosp. 9 TaxID=1416803 RepID=UPI000A290EF0|nr:hypothetical protein [Bordetella genomosp. 9]ARP91480.1 hypothetical protein CAL14_15295 [Bordetella genomosp. 9]